MNKTGFSAVEVMATLIIAAIFLFAGYQLFATVYDQQLASRLRSEASHIAYAHLREKSANLSVNVCSASGPVEADEALDGNDTLPGIAIKSIVSAPYGCAEKLRRIEIQVKYLIGSSEQIEKQVIYVDKTTH